MLTINTSWKLPPVSDFVLRWWRWFRIFSLMFVLLGKVSRQQNRMAFRSVYVSSSHLKEPERPNDTCHRLPEWLAVVRWYGNKQLVLTCLCLKLSLSSEELAEIIAWTVQKSRSGMTFSKLSTIQSRACFKCTQWSLISYPVTKNTVVVQTKGFVALFCIFTAKKFQPKALLAQWNHV